jgi:hypothetical protein
MDYEIQPMEFSILRKGGPENAYASDALVFQNGRLWSGSGRAWQKVSFRQKPVVEPEPGHAVHASMGRAR